MIYGNEDLVTGESSTDLATLKKRVAELEGQLDN
jgi:hypothetical protein